MSEQGIAVVVEDDADVRNLVCAVLKQAGFSVAAAATGKEGVELVRLHNPSVVTLDVGLPDIDGYEVLRQVRHITDCYVVMLTARAEELDTLTALQSGADDYVIKPFRPRELRARISAMLRRPRSQTSANAGSPPKVAASAATPPPRKDTMEHNGLSVNRQTRTADLNGRELVLTKSEFEVLLELLKREGAVCTKADLVRSVRGEYFRVDSYISEADERAVEVHVGNLRRKLGEDSASPKWFQTVRGVGYRLAPALDG
ncbi:response regulator transcription factor [Arthrobacter sp. KK5.5]|uniref:response regulator transcription factor n=1 Tax=Arthrobacter sp. KK5.5 TaxID=3373084 RepID=UPI003EE72CF4